MGARENEREGGSVAGDLGGQAQFGVLFLTVRYLEKNVGKIEGLII